QPQGRSGSDGNLEGGLSLVRRQTHTEECPTVRRVDRVRCNYKKMRSRSRRARGRSITLCFMFDSLAAIFGRPLRDQPTPPFIIR
ncbi:MAG: hypothetical protein ABI680_07715, partial [Chthoniobacteraceae bacterium]